ncbi:hypothetical protein C8R45DRAFT_633768 [Mycena sanguinolenta]|nr:hypothetical protein C8R45DRAFT_633768 [Mycena sanguinolenta]
MARTTTLIIETLGGAPIFHIPFPISSLPLLAGMSSGASQENGLGQGENGIQNNTNAAECEHVDLIFRNHGGTPTFHVGGADVGVGPSDAWDYTSVVNAVMAGRAARVAGANNTDLRVKVEEESPRIPRQAKGKERQQDGEEAVADQAERQEPSNSDKDALSARTDVILAAAAERARARVRSTHEQTRPQPRPRERRREDFYVAPHDEFYVAPQNDATGSELPTEASRTPPPRLSAQSSDNRAPSADPALTKTPTPSVDDRGEPQTDRVVQELRRALDPLRDASGIRGGFLIAHLVLVWAAGVWRQLSPLPLARRVLSISRSHGESAAIFLRFFIPSVSCASCSPSFADRHAFSLLRERHPR